MGVKMNFIVNNRLNQDLKQKAVGPLFFKRNSTYARFTFSGLDLVPLLTPVGGAGELARARATCGCAAQNGRPKMGLKKFPLKKFKKTQNGHSVCYYY